MMNTESETRPAPGSPTLLTRPFGLASLITPPRFRVDTIAFADIGLIALLTLLTTQTFLFSPGVPINLPTVESSESIVGVHAEAVATVWKGKMITPRGSYPLERMDSALADLFVESGHPSPDLLLLVDQSTSVEGLTGIYESARRAGFATVQLAARPADTIERAIPD